MKRIVALVSVLVFAAPAVSWSQAEDLPPEVSLDGLEQVEKTRHRELYIAPDVDWGVYEKITIDEASVAFRKNWQRDQNRRQGNRIRAEDMDRIRMGMSELFDEVFITELVENGGYEISDTPGEDVLRISPHIVDLDVYAPDPRYSAGIQQSYAESLGRMTLKLHFYDSHTGDLIAVFSEHREAPRRGYMQWANTVSNTKEFRIMLRSWAQELREGLDEAKSK